MPTVVTCPDCGGVIGGNGPEGTYPCRCLNSGDTQSIPGLVEPKPKSRVCCKCGTDLAGKKRYKDSVGYWCANCHRADRSLNEPQGVRCSDCGRVFPEDRLNQYESLLICTSCLKDRKEVSRRKIKTKVDTRYHQEHEYRRLLVLLGVFLVLLFLALLSYLGVIGESANKSQSPATQPSSTSAAPPRR